ncbi:unnamed protein product, partial [Polarella glacialis]
EGRPASCWETSVLDSTSDGWDGQCDGLSETGDTSEPSCRESCSRDPLCSVFQFTQSNACFQGTTQACGSVEGSPMQLVSAERLQHGDVRVLKDMTGLLVENLRPLGSMALGGQAAGIRACRNYCYSTLTCQYWQFSQQSGCSVEDPTVKEENEVFGQDAYFIAQYPLTLAGGVVAMPPVVAGEYIQHICPAPSASLGGFAAASAWSELSPRWLPWITGGVVLITLAGVV